MNRVAAFALRRKNSILSMSEKVFCPPQPLRFWIAPAYAGKRRSDWIIRSIYWDHPRACGEKTEEQKERAEYLGSPPRVRGKAEWRRSANHNRGITPACAGKSRNRCEKVQRGRDHPRVCGEKPRPDWRQPMGKGSPPRVRGKVGHIGLFRAITGITPACAGKSSLTLLWSGPLRDHPRACGEKKKGGKLGQPG